MKTDPNTELAFTGLHDLSSGKTFMHTDDMNMTNDYSK
uniref:Uncharacterized protein n=1 Tax=Rhizophora mucronata TaxID=61149 RepID=A0A2P2QWX3_RHIMU